MPPRKRPAAAVGAGAANKRPAAASAGSSVGGSKGTFANPVLRGGFPDPSICRVGDDYYMCNSSFEYFPGLPIHHSKDLLNWEWVGYGLHRPEQCHFGGVNLVDVKQEDGIQAPSLRYHKGTFYIITTCVYRPPGTDDGTCTNFIITASDIRGPWSMPHILAGAPGIDPDIFFDDDGKVWYVGTHAVEPAGYPGEGEIWSQEIDLANWTLAGERHNLWRGALHQCMFVEGPHLYKHFGRYYLMVAEGGTGSNHAVTIAVADKVTGPYLGNERNPILTSRHLTQKNWVGSTGHADIIQLPDNRWYMFLLGVQGNSNMGRETHLVPVLWEQEQEEWKNPRHWWPVAAPETGRVEHTGNPVPFKGTKQILPSKFRDDFDEETLDFEWNFRRVPRPGTYSLTTRKGFLRLFAKPETIAPCTPCSLLGIRQRERCFVFKAAMEFHPASLNIEAGIALFQKDDNYVTLTLKRSVNGFMLQLVSVEPPDGKTVNIGTEILEGYAGSIEFQVELLDQTLDDPGTCKFSFRMGRSSSWTSIGGCTGDICRSRGYTGAYFGLYCTSNGQESSVCADFDWVELVNIPPSL